MSASLQGKRILVTGAAAGIGHGIARACANAGASVIVADINSDGAENAAAELGGDIVAATLDVSSTNDIRNFFENLEGPLDGLVNNAGVTIEADFLDFPEEDLERLWQTDLRSVFCMCQQAGKYMKDSGGAIVNISSVHGNASTPGFEMYAAVKAGITAMTRAISWSLGSYGIRVNALSPGLTHTEAVAQILKEKPHLARPWSTMHATGKYATVDEIGEIAAFLLSDGAAAITGTELVADHGLSALLAPAENIT